MPHALWSLLLILAIVYGASLVLTFLYWLIALLVQVKRDPLFLLMQEDDRELHRDFDLFMGGLAKDRVFRFFVFPWILVIHLGYLVRKAVRGNEEQKK